MSRVLSLLALTACAPGGADPATLPGAAPPPPELDVVLRVNDPSVEQVAMVPLPGGVVAVVNDARADGLPDLTAGVGLVSFHNGALRIDPAPIDAALASGLALGDVDQDGDDELLVRALDAVTAWDPATWQLVRRIPVISLDVERWSRFTVGQADADPQPELITSGDLVRVYDLDGTVQAVALARGRDVVQADTDPQLEVARYNGTFYDLLTGDVQPALHPGVALPTADVTGDGVPELLTDDVLVDPTTGGELARGWYQSLPWQVTPLREPGGVVGLYTPTYRFVGRLDPSTWTVATGLAVPDVDAIAAMDVNGDGVDELLAAREAGLTLWDTQTGAKLGELAARVRVATTTADGDGDGDEDVLVATNEGVEVRDATDLSVLARHPLPGLAALTAARGGAAGTLAWRTTDGVLHIGAIGPAGLTSQASRPGASAGPWTGDANGDGVDEVFAVLDGETCALQPASRRQWCVPYAASHVAVADLDGDGRIEVILQTLLGTYVARGTTGNIVNAWASEGASLTALGADVLLVRQALGFWQTARVTLAGPRDPGDVLLGGYTGLRVLHEPGRPGGDRWIAASEGNVAVVDPVSRAVEIVPAVHVDPALAVVVGGRLWLPSAGGGWTGVDL